MIALVTALLLASLPYWLPPAVVRLRMKIFTRINGEEALQVPNETLGPADFRRIYEHPGARGRSRGARLSDLFWYWLSPGPAMHQEHLEDGPRYDKLASLNLLSAHPWACCCWVLPGQREVLASRRPQRWLKRRPN